MARKCFFKCDNGDIFSIDDVLSVRRDGCSWRVCLNAYVKSDQSDRGSHLVISENDYKRLAKLLESIPLSDCQSVSVTHNTPW